MTAPNRRRITLAMSMALIAVFALSFALIRAERQRQARLRAVERLAWSERMHAGGYVSAAQVAADRAILKSLDTRRPSR